MGAGACIYVCHISYWKLNYRTNLNYLSVYSSIYVCVFCRIIPRKAENFAAACLGPNFTAIFCPAGIHPEGAAPHENIQSSSCVTVIVTSLYIYTYLFINSW